MTDEPTPDQELRTSDCTVCRHERAADIDQALLGGTSIRDVAGTFGVARSSVGRHRLNHLSAGAITDEPAEPGDGERRPLQLVEVHGRLAELADRLEKVIELATRTRKAPAAVTAIRELRQTLEAIARIQADPELQRAASLQHLQEGVEHLGKEALVDMLWFVLTAFGPEFDVRVRGGEHQDQEQRRIVGRLVSACLRAFGDTKDLANKRKRFADVDTSDAREFVERQALEQARRMEAEVRRRVAAELRRREAQARPAIEARPVRELEGGATWSA